MPCSYSSCSRTSRNVASSPSRSSAASGVDLGDPRLRLGEQLTEAGHGCSWESRYPAGRNATAGVGYSQRPDLNWRHDHGRARLRPGRRARGASSPSGSRRTTASATASNGVSSALHDHEPGAVATARSRGARRPGRRRARCPSARNTSARRGGPLRPVEVLGHEVLAEADRRRLQDPAAVEARRDPPRRPRPARGSRPSGRASRTAGTSPRARCRGSRRSSPATDPAARCSPSTFWVTSVCTRLAARAPTSARCPAFGCAAQISLRSRFCHACRRISGSAT